MSSDSDDATNADDLAGAGPSNSNRDDLGHSNVDDSESDDSRPEVEESDSSEDEVCFIFLSLRNA